MNEGPSKRTTMRNALRSALAAAALAGTAAKAEAQGITPYDVGGPEHTQTARKNSPEGAAIVDAGAGVQPEEHIAAAFEEDQQMMAEFLRLREHLRGFHITNTGREVTWEQYEQFCDELSIFCEHFARASSLEQDADLTPESYARIKEVNAAVAAKVFPAEDLKLYGLSEKWTIPDAAGDCEDAVLLKMVRLIDAGIDPSRLHILVVRQQSGEGHAVLGVDVPVDSKWNTLVLDNLTDAILPIEEMEKNYSGAYASFVTAGPEGRRVRFYEYEKAAR